MRSDDDRRSFLFGILASTVVTAGIAVVASRGAWMYYNGNNNGNNDDDDDDDDNERGSGRRRTTRSGPRVKRRADGADDSARSETTGIVAASSAYEQLIGATPLIRLPNLSALMRRDVYAKMESSNPGGTGKDRAALGMILEAERNGSLPPPLRTTTTTTTIQETHDLQLFVEEQEPEDDVVPRGDVVNQTQQQQQQNRKNDILPSDTTSNHHQQHHQQQEQQVGIENQNNNYSSNKGKTTSSATTATNTTTTKTQTAQQNHQNKAKPETKVAITDAAMDEMISEAMRRSKTGGLVVEGTSGSTGIALANIAKCRGHACIVVLPDDQAAEKRVVLERLHAVVRVVPASGISNPNHYVNVARRIARRANQATPNGTSHQRRIRAVFMDQFENDANFRVHYRQTGPEIYQQMRTMLVEQPSSIFSRLCNRHKQQPLISAFVMSSGTGGTISGASRYLKERAGRGLRTVLVDPNGSSLYNKIAHGVAYASQQRERSLKRHRYDTIAEGIGLDRVTRNLALGLPYIDTAIRVSDQEALDMAHYLLQIEGLWIGSSSAMNVVGAVRTALDLPEGSRIVTVICDGGHRHVTRFWNRDFCINWGLSWPGDRLNEKDQLPACLRDIA